MKYIVYKTTNTINGKVYIGIHATESLFEFDGYWGSGRLLKNAIRKYGEEFFIRETLSAHTHVEDAYEREAKLVTLDFVKDVNTYNLMPGGFGGKGGHLTEEHKRKLSEANVGKVPSEECRRKLSEALSGEKHPNYGKHLSEECRRKLSEAFSGEKNPNYGKALSEECRRKLSEALSGEKHPNYGKHLSEECRRKIGVAHVGKHLSEEHCNKIGDSKRGEKNPYYGKHLSEEHRRKIGESHRGEKNYNYGKQHSEETKLKISVGNTGKIVSEEHRRKISVAKLGKNMLSFEIFQQRLQDIKQENYSKGWAYRLAGQWNMHPKSAQRFVRKYKEVSL